jgi:hypothetical protein
MTKCGKSAHSAWPGAAYFARRSRGGCAVIKLYPNEREEVVASGLELADAENLCVRKIDEVRGSVPPPSDNPGPNRIIGRRKARQLAFKF